MFLSRGILIIISIFSFNGLFAQEKEDLYYDIRVKKHLDSLDINYSITKLNNFTVNLITEESPQKRTQLVVINSKLVRYNNYKIREIESRSFTLPKKDGKTPIFLELLKENGSLKTGNWSIIEFDAEPDIYTIIFSVNVSPNISADDLYSMIFLVATEADRFEKKYMKGADEN